jgi:hypothetical protein
MPQIDWSRANSRLRKTKGLLLPSGEWVDDTRAMDLMLGAWDETTERRAAVAYSVGQTLAGQTLLQPAIGWHALAELASQSGTPKEQAFMPTVNRGPEHGGGMLIDWLLVNNEWQEGLVPGSYQVHAPESSDHREHPSDHRLVTAKLQL